MLATGSEYCVSISVEHIPFREAESRSPCLL
jgi:hypothetical protein